jgi:hypothetical protein
VPLIFSNVLPDKPKISSNSVADLEAEIARKTERLNSLYGLEDLESAKEHIRNLDAEIRTLRERLSEVRKTTRMASHVQGDRLDQLLEMLLRLHVADEDGRYLLRVRIAQELRRVVDRIVLKPNREMRVVLRPASGYGAEMEFRNGRFETLWLTDIDTGETEEIDRLLFLETQRHMLSRLQSSRAPRRVPSFLKAAG